MIPDNFEKKAITFLLAALAVLMLAEALCRHLRPAAAPAVLKLAAACLAWMVSLGMARVAALGAHIRMSFLGGVVSAACRDRLSRFADLTFLLFAVSTFAAGSVALFLSLRYERLPSHPLVYAAIPAGSLLAIVRLIGRLRRSGGGGEAA